MSGPVLDIEYETGVAETDDAYCFLIEGEEVWIPKSQVSDLDREACIVTIPEWLAFEKGLI